MSRERPHTERAAAYASWVGALAGGPRIAACAGLPSYGEMVNVGTWLVTGASSGIGHGVARSALARVFAIGSRRVRFDVAHDFGATDLVDYHDEGWVEAIIEANGGPVDAVMVCGGTEDSINDGLRMLKSGGTLVNLAAFFGGKPIPIDPAAFGFGYGDKTIKGVGCGGGRADPPIQWQMSGNRNREANMDKDDKGINERDRTESVLETSRRFWDAMERADEEGMRALADPRCCFVHIGITAGLDQEIEFYTSGAFKPTDITFHSQDAHLFGDTAVAITDCDYSLLLDGNETTHHFAVTEVYTQREDGWKLVQFSFTALVY